MKCPLILVSGLLSNEYLWRHQIRNLQDVATIQVVSPSQNRAEMMVEEVLKAAPPKFALAGHSMGGWLCLEIMRTVPSRVLKLCLLNTTARDDSQEKKERRKSTVARVNAGHFEEVVQEIADLFVHNPIIKQDAKKMFLEVGSEAFIRQEEAMLGRKSSELILPTIFCRTLVIHAAQDKNFSLEEHQELLAKISHAKLAIIEDSGHMSPLEMPQAVTSLIRFWLTYF